MKEPGLSAGAAAASAARLKIGSKVSIVSGSAEECEFRGSAAVLLAWVALEGHADRRRISAALWPESTSGQARSNLRVLIHRINQRFGGELLSGAEQLVLDAAQLLVEQDDLETTLAALGAGGATRCELLGEAGLEAGASELGDALQAWLEGARRRLKREQLSRLDVALAQAHAEARQASAATLARACVQLDPLSEHRHRQLMEALVLAGDRAAALSAYDECQAVLRRHLGALPDPQTRAVQLRILQDQAWGLAPGGPQAPRVDDLTRPGGATRYPLVEREALLAQAQAALDLNQHVVVQGEPGVGKTRLLRHLAARAGSDCELVVMRAALRHEPYAAIAQLLQAVQPQRAPCIGVPEQVELARLAPLVFSAVKPSEAALSAPRLHAALQQWVTGLGQAGLRVLVLDDIQYADAPSQAALASLLQGAPEAAGQPVALLLGHRSGEIEPLLDHALTDAQTRRRAQRLEVQRLTPAGVQALLRTMDLAQRTHEPEALAQQLHKRTGGNPLFVIELAQQALEPGQPAAATNLLGLLVASLDACGQAAQQLAAVAAVADADFTVELAAAVTGQPPLGLMPAWRELQRRGLFAGHGLAHDLVHDAALSRLPRAILQVLHRQVAQVLEGQGAQGASVLRHWRAADAADQALPHAVHQLYAVSAAGLPTAHQELTLLEVLERASDAVLMAHLWLTAEIDNNPGEATSVETWRRVRALRQRVESLPRSSGVAAWIAFETARGLRFIDAAHKAASDILQPAAGQMPERGIERAFVERELAMLTLSLTGVPQAHLRRAQTALAGLADAPSVHRVRMEIIDLAGIYLNPLEGIRAQAARWRRGRRRQDLATVADASSRLASLQAFLGNASHALNHHLRAARWVVAGTPCAQAFSNPLPVGKVALNAGHYALSHRLLLAGDDRITRSQRSAYLAVLYLRLGDMPQASAQLGQVTPEALREYFSTQAVYAHARATLDRHEGRDPLPGLAQQFEQARASGSGGINLDLLAWEMQRHTQPLAERLATANALLAHLRRHETGGMKLARVLLEVAEVSSEAGVPQWQSMAAESARLLRRGCTNATLYLPEGLLRCARLIRQCDAREADALVQVAQRWLCDAVRRLPPGAEGGFVRNVQVNRLLLGTDTQALYAAPLM